MHRKFCWAVRSGLSGARIACRAGPPAGARVGDEELRRAAEDLERARTDAGAAGAGTDGGASRRGPPADPVGAPGRRGGRRPRCASPRPAGGPGPGRRRCTWPPGAGSGARWPSGTEAAVRRTYAAAVAARDQEVVNALTAAAADRDRWRRALQEAGAGAGGAGPAPRGDRRGGGAGAGRGRGGVRPGADGLGGAGGGTACRRSRGRGAPPHDRHDHHQHHGGGRAGHDDHDHRGPAAPSTTTTTTTGHLPTRPPRCPDPVEGGLFPPLVERWRPLVAAYFPAALVDEALAVMRCESLGDPSIVNPVSGAAGLFQHMPRYWPARAAAAGFPGASPLGGGGQHRRRRRGWCGSRWRTACRPGTSGAAGPESRGRGAATPTACSTLAWRRRRRSPWPHSTWMLSSTASASGPLRCGSGGSHRSRGRLAAATWRPPRPTTWTTP